MQTSLSVGPTVSVAKNNTAWIFSRNRVAPPARLSATNANKLINFLQPTLESQLTHFSKVNGHLRQNASSYVPHCNLPKPSRLLKFQSKGMSSKPKELNSKLGMALKEDTYLSVSKITLLW